MMYEELIKSLRICTDENTCAGCIKNTDGKDYYDSINCDIELVRDAADAIEKLQAYADLYRDGGETAMRMVEQYKARIEELQNRVPKTPQTNADRIRAMTDEELADWIAQILTYHQPFSADDDCPHECPLYKCCNDQPSDNIEDWLKAPVEVDK